MQTNGTGVIMKVGKRLDAILDRLEARKLLSKGHIQHNFARDCDGIICSPRSPKAVAFCAWGAVIHANGPGEKKALKLLRFAAFQIRKERYNESSGRPTNEDIFTVNDSYGWKDVKEMFRNAIKAARA